MRYTKIALLTFGAGIVLGLVVVTAEIDRFDRVASGVMALGLAAIPVGIVLDWRRATRTAKRPVKKPVGARSRRRAAQPAKRAPRTRKPAAPKR